jgi:hypothetical protein
LLDKHINYHTILHEFYNYCRKNKPQNRSSIDHTCGELDLYQSKIMMLPAYMVEYFHTVKNDIIRVNRAKKPMEDILNRIVDRELFFDRIGDDLENAVNEYRI